MISINQFGILIRDVANFAGNEEEISEILDDGESFESADLSKFEDQIKSVLADLNEKLNGLPFIDNPEVIELDDIRNTLGDVAKDVASWIGDTALSIAQNTPRFAINLIVFIMLLIMFIPSQHNLKERLLKLSPLDNDIDSLYISKVSAMAKSMVRGTFVIAFVQGIICGILLFMAGVPYVFFWTFLCMVISIIPNGGALVNWPITIVLLLSGNFVGAIILILGNIFVVASVDNILRPYLVSKEAQLHPGLTLIGVAGGVQVFGVLGLIYGPVIMILLATTIDIYLSHYKTS
jgi:predicted PurR-regulated permease PerM